MQELINNLIHLSAEENERMADAQLKILKISSPNFEDVKISDLNDLYKGFEFIEEMIVKKKQIVQRLIDTKEGKIK